MSESDPPSLPESTVQSRHRRPFQLVWLIPIVAAVVAGWLGYRAIASRGEQIRIVFATGDGLVAGQTKVRHKAVDLGTVRQVTLSSDLRKVEVRVDMARAADRFLTDAAQFWVVRPRLSGSTVSGLDTLVSGSYIEMDPGSPDNRPAKTEFDGLDEPPAVRSDEPGSTFTLRSDSVGSLSSGAPVFYRSVQVGELLGYDPIRPGQPVTLHAFIRSPFDQYVKRGTHFWNASGVSFDLAASGLRIKLESLQALLSGGIAFDTPPAALKSGDSAVQTVFTLYDDQAAATAAGYSHRLPFVTYFDSSVRGLAAGAAVEFFGLQVGSVTDVHLDFDPEGRHPRVVVKMEVQPERFAKPGEINDNNTREVAQRLVDHGMRAQLRSANLLTGQQVIGFDFVADALPATVSDSPDGVVIPSSTGGLDSITASLSAVASKIDSLPLEQIGRNLNDSLHGVSALVNSPDLKQTLASLNATTKHLPEVAAGLQTTVQHASRLAGSVDAGYGADSQFSRDLERLLGQASDAARSVRLLADYLDQHPEALLLGRTGRAAER